MSRVEVIQWFIDFLGAKTYLEIGVRNGESFNPVRCANKVAVDLHFPLRDEGTYYEMSSDKYFLSHASPFDVAFIDGDHTYEQSLRDAENCLRWMNPNGAILLHDCNPTRAELATPEFGAYPDWCGEVWKTVLTLRTNPDLYVAVLDADFGMGLVTKGGQEPLPYSKEQIKSMTYKDLEENRDLFLNLVRQYA